MLVIFVGILFFGCILLQGLCWLSLGEFYSLGVYCYRGYLWGNFILWGYIATGVSLIIETSSLNRFLRKKKIFI
jgi:hypothetical protein